MPFFREKYLPFTILLEKAKTKEEKEFVRLVTDFVLQQRQKKAIAEKRF